MAQELFRNKIALFKYFLPMWAAFTPFYPLTDSGKRLVSLRFLFLESKLPLERFGNEMDSEIFIWMVWYFNFLSI
jgi:hypothetical protein